MIGEKLKTLRENLHLTQKEVSISLNLSEARYNQYETNRRNPDYATLKEIATFYNVSIDFLLGHTSKKTTTEEEKAKEKEALKKVLVEAGYMKENEDLSKEELERLMKFVKSNKEFIKEMK